MKRLIPGVCEALSDETNPDLYHELEADTLARTLWGEARGEGTIGMQAVSCVILNRVRTAQIYDGMWWGNNIIQVCHKPYQFSCWNKDDPNFKQLLAVAEDNLYFAAALRIARRAVFAPFDDLTLGADHYHADHIKPYWARHQTPVCRIGRHIFYKLERS